MTQNTYAFEFAQDINVLRAALGKAPPAINVRGAAFLKPMRLLHCVLLMLGGVSIGYLISDVISPRATVMHWGTALGLALSYIAVFGSIFIVAPVMLRQTLATRANQGDVTIEVDEQGMTIHSALSRSWLGWRGFEGFTRSKLGFVFWFGGNRPGIPFAAFENAAQIDAFEADVTHWMEAIR